jgi:DNA replication protein DnaC
MDARKEPDATSSKRHDALGALERTIPPAYQWSRFSAPELPMRVAPSAIAQAQASWRDPRVCLMGVSRAGKTSLAVAMLRQWVRSSERSAAFLRAYKLAGARLRHPAGHGEPEIVELALKAPLVLIDDLGCERDSPTNAVVDVIFERHDDGLPTWVTTGLTREQLLARYGLGVVARIFERARVVRVGEGGRVRAGPERCGE